MTFFGGKCYFYEFLTSFKISFFSVHNPAKSWPFADLKLFQLQHSQFTLLLVSLKDKNKTNVVSLTRVCR